MIVGTETQLEVTKNEMLGRVGPIIYVTLYISTVIDAILAQDNNSAENFYMGTQRFLLCV